MNEIAPAKKGRPPKEIIADEKWEEARNLIISRPDLSYAVVAKTVGIPVNSLTARAVRLNWQAQRDQIEAVNINDKLQNIIEQIAAQISDMNVHLVGMVEGLQNAYRIKIVKNLDGTISYKNFDDYPGRPDNWHSLTTQEQEALLRYIPPARFVRFIEDLMKIFSYKTNIINFVAKFVKGSLPKIDPFTLDLSKRDIDKTVVDDIPVISLINSAREQEDE